MQRTLMAAAVALLATGSAFAQSSVTIYGRANVTVESLDRDGVKTTELVNNASRLGFKGTEDLGGGLKANFVLEHRFSIDTGIPSSTFWAGQSELNLESASFGTLRLGQFTSEAYYATADYISMHNHDTGTSSDALYAYLGRDTNKIAYRLPTLVKGLQLEGAVSMAEGSANLRTYDFAANYQLGSLALGAGYQKFGDDNQFAVRALYEVGSFVFGAYVQQNEDVSNARGDRTTFRLSGAYNVGASEFHLNFGAADDYSNVADSDAQQFTLGYNYNLSKRTKVYGLLHASVGRRRQGLRRRLQAPSPWACATTSERPRSETTSRPAGRLFHARFSHAGGAARAAGAGARAPRGCRSSWCRCRHGPAAAAPRAGRRRGSAGGWRRRGAACAATAAR